MNLKIKVNKKKYILFVSKGYIDMSGGIQESIENLNKSNHDELWQFLKKAFEKGALMGCSIHVFYISL